MYFKQKSNVIFRNYDSFGYITDNRNFGYKQKNDLLNDIGDKIISQSGAVFFSALDRETPYDIDYIVKKIKIIFQDTDIVELKNDAQNFYYLLENEGFVISGNTIEECLGKEDPFTYDNVLLNFSKSKDSIQKSTQSFFDDYFGDKPRLTNLHIEITSKCNERCIHCYIPHENKIHTMSSSLFYDILYQCKEMNVLHLTLSGGEPLLHKEFIPFIKKCNEYNFSVNILTNLTLLTNEIVDEMKNNPLLSVQTSLYSMNANIHDEITTVAGSFDKTKKAILKLRENNIPLQISCPIMKKNLNSYKEVIDWGNSLNINVGTDYVIIAKYNHATQNLSNRLDFNDIKNLIEQNILESPQYIMGIENELERKKDVKPNDYICSVCHSSICISEIGMVYPCAGWQGYVLGDINQTSLSNIWDNSSKVHFLRNLKRSNFHKCLQCQEKDFCTMCMVRNANENTQGDPLIVNEYFCNIAKIIKTSYNTYKHKQSRWV
jgi:radical SAM protein with 4Fe4S-binding SPASM domain